jgi:hypothetical protein
MWLEIQFMVLAYERIQLGENLLCASQVPPREISYH